MDVKLVEKLKREYTDKYVVVDETRPELRRFKGMTGTVKTVNMNGRALVEFDGNNNRGWYDIELDFLKVIDEPLPRAEKPAKKPAPRAKKAPSEPEKAGGEKPAKEAEKAQSPPTQDAPAATETTARTPKPDAEPAPAAEEKPTSAAAASAHEETPGEAAENQKPSGESAAAD